MNEDTLASYRRRYLPLFDESPTPPQLLAEIEARLQVKLPDDLKAIATFHSGGAFALEEVAFDTKGPATNIVEETERLRDGIGLPSRFLVLLEDFESVIALDVESGAVTWCADYDIYSLDNPTTMQSHADTWPSYATFFEFMLDKEERERANG